MQNNFSQRARVSPRRILATMAGIEKIDESLVLNESALRQSGNRGPPAAALNPARRLALPGMIMTLDNVVILDEAPRNAGERLRRDPPSQRFNRVIPRDESCRLADVLELLRPKKYERTGESETCCVCQEDFEDGELVAALTCDHNFHAGCIARWLAGRNFCPMCRTALPCR